ncbi:MAG: 3-oxoacyl-[acyl-carrier-protein] synthase III C-terminal domain-containing protein [Thermocrispum sp.]
MVDVYADNFVHALAEEKVHISHSERHGRLFSPAADLLSAGFEWHHVCKPGTSAYDLARAAVSQLPTALFSGFDAIVYATCLPLNGNVGDDEQWRISGDVMHLMDFPASRLQADFSLDRAIVVGLNQQGCTSMLGALRLARALLASEPGWERVLCVTADRFPDRALREHTYNLVSDSAAACVVGRAPTGFRLVACHQITNGGLHGATNDETVGNYFSYVHLLVSQTLRQAGLTAADLGWIVPQNTHRTAWQIMSRSLEVEYERIWQPSLPDNGHAISADNIINLSSLAGSGLLRPGQYVLLVMAGYGLNWQAVLLEATEDFA